MVLSEGGDGLDGHPRSSRTLRPVRIFRRGATSVAQALDRVLANHRSARGEHSSASQLVEPFQPVAWTATRMEHRNQEKRFVTHGVDQLDRKASEYHPAKPEGCGRLVHYGERFWVLQREGDSFVEFLDQPRAEPLLTLLVVDYRILVFRQRLGEELRTDHWPRTDRSRAMTLARASASSISLTWPACNACILRISSATCDCSTPVSSPSSSRLSSSARAALARSSTGSLSSSARCSSTRAIYGESRCRALQRQATLRPSPQCTATHRRFRSSHLARD